MQLQKDYDVVVMGNVFSGKTSLINFLASGQKGMTIPTLVIDRKVIEVNVGNRCVKLLIWDTVGQETHLSMATTTIKKAQGVILVYSITDCTSFEAVNKWKFHADENCQKDVPCILVGTKLDLENDPQNPRKISRDVAHQFAQQKGMSFWECSSETGQNLENMIKDLTKKMILRTSEKQLDKDMKVPIVNIKLKEQQNSIKRGWGCC